MVPLLEKRLQTSQGNIKHVPKLRRETMKEVTTLGIDLAKRVFQGGGPFH